VNRHCQTCGKRYHRRDLLELWQQVAGGRWVKRTVKQCLHCQTPATTRRLLMVAHVQIGPRGAVSRAVG
jgi:hypothetical protein